MRCPLCGNRFAEGEGITTCQGCPWAGACNMVKCPNCGYDIPMEPKFLRVFKRWRERRHGTGRKR